MFEHSIKVPRLYKTAARIVERVKKEGTSVKQLVYEKKHPNLKALYALVVETLRNEENLKNIFKKTQIFEKENRLDQFLARVLITELLWGKKKLPGESKPIKTILSYQDQFLDDYTNQKSKSKKQKVNKPKYVRVNTLKISMEDVIDTFRNEGWSLIRCGDGSDYSAFLATSAALSEDQFMVDTLIKDLLIFPPRTEFYEHRLYKNGSIVLQDKASCLSPFLLAPPLGATVLDMCAAPGMKCMQVASMVGENGKVYAVERDSRRYDILKSLLEGTDSKNVTPINNDVLKLTDFDVPDVEYILVDPSCSGSGIIDRIDFEDNPQIDGPRLSKLAGFQIKILRHALENFKNVKRIVYSTCSIYPDENEVIVQEAIEKTPNFKLVALNELLKNKWYNFGSKEYKIGPRCLYAKPEIDKTNGFFIAVFEKLREGETNEFYIEKKVFQKQSCDNEENQDKDKTEYNKKNKNRLKGNPEGSIAEENHLGILNENLKSKKSEIETNNFVKSYENETNQLENSKKHKKKCKKSKKELDEPPFEEFGTPTEPKSKKKRKNSTSTAVSDNIDTNLAETLPQNYFLTETTDLCTSKKKKWKNSNGNDITVDSTAVSGNIDTNLIQNLPQNYLSEDTLDLGSTKKKKRNKKNHKNETEVIGLELTEDIQPENCDSAIKTKKKLKKKSREVLDCQNVTETDDIVKNLNGFNKNEVASEIVSKSKSKKKRKKDRGETGESENMESCTTFEEIELEPKKKKKSKDSVEIVEKLNENVGVSEKSKKCKKSHKNKENIDETDVILEKKVKKKSKKDKIKNNT